VFKIRQTRAPHTYTLDPIGVMLLFFPMPQRQCPVCRIEGTLLEHSSQDAVVDYFRCSQCGRIWTHRKGDPNSLATDVTVPAKPPKAD
jgi:rubredoxin